MTYTLDDGAIWITTDSSADDEQYSVIYDVNDIIASMSDSLAEPDYQSLIDMIQAQTGGSGTISTDSAARSIPFPKGGSSSAAIALFMTRLSIC